MAAIALLGTGIMGTPMARNLIKHGFEVRVWNRTRARAEPLAGDGATVTDSPAEAVEGADVVITMLLDGDAVLAAMRDAAPALRPGLVWAQMSTVGVAAMERLSALASGHGLVLVDAPVQGTKQPAELGKLVILAAGPESARGPLEPVFGALGSRTLWVGDDAARGNGTRLKMATVGFAITMNTIVAEALALTKGLGLDPAQFAEVVTGGPLDNPYVQAKMKAVRDGDYEPSFSLRNAEKDTRLVSQAGDSAGVRVDMIDAAGERFRRAIDQGHGDEDMAATYFASFPDQG